MPFVCPIRFSPGYSTLERLNKKPDMKQWRRKIACDWARSGKIPGVLYREKHRMTLLSTRVEATGRHHDSGHTEKDTGTKTENHVCWEDSRAKRTGGASPKRTGGAKSAEGRSTHEAR